MRLQIKNTMNSADTKDHPQVVALPPLLLLACAALGTLLHFVCPYRLVANFPVKWVGVALALAAIVQILFARRAMIAVGTNIRPDLPTLAIVRMGPYRYTRNPMYLSLCALQVSLALILNDLSPLLLAVVLILILHFGVIIKEERYLEEKFGDNYLELKREVRRWF
jgi:protein-S-isoprenylcysteine O-methyltransferase Ste14